nr:hypothetical protein Iba_scaffold1290CG0010 [Ipomoea batatas]
MQPDQNSEIGNWKLESQQRLRRSSATRLLPCSVAGAPLSVGSAALAPALPSLSSHIRASLPQSAHMHANVEGMNANGILVASVQVGCTVRGAAAQRLIFLSLFLIFNFAAFRTPVIKRFKLSSQINASSQTKRRAGVDERIGSSSRLQRSEPCPIGVDDSLDHRNGLKAQVGEDTVAPENADPQYTIQPLQDSYIYGNLP